MLKLNEDQEKALLAWTARQTRWDIMGLMNDIHKLAQGEVRELRIISEFGIAGKLWNNGGKIYVSGYSQVEISKDKYDKHQVRINELNREIDQLMDMFDD